MGESKVWERNDYRQRRMRGECNRTASSIQHYTIKNNENTHEHLFTERQLTMYQCNKDYYLCMKCRREPNQNSTNENTTPRL